MRLAVTGAGGFIGTKVAEQAIGAGSEVVPLHRSDLQDFARLARALEGVDALIHLAWYAVPGDYLTNLTANLQSLQTSIAVMRACLTSGVRRIVLAGTCLENSDEAFPSPYRAAKAAQHLLGEQLNASGSSVACAHIFHLYGPGEDERRVIPTVIRGLLESRNVPVTSGEQRRDYLHVSDVASALLAICGAEVQGGIDVSSGSWVTLREVFVTLARLIGRGSVDLGAVEYSKAELFRTLGDPAPLAGCGWERRYPLEEGLADTVDWWVTKLGSK